MMCVLCIAYQQRSSEIIQYADLDLMQSPGEVKKSPLAGRQIPDKPTDYEEVDMVKTQALANTKKEIETGRKFSDRSLDG